MDEEQRRRLREDIMRELDERQTVSDNELYDMIDRRLLDQGQNSFLPLKDQVWLRSRLFDSFRRLGALQELVDDRDISEIMVNGADRIFVERKGHMARWEKSFDSQEQLEDTYSRSSAG